MSRFRSRLDRVADRGEPTLRAPPRRRSRHGSVTGSMVHFSASQMPLRAALQFRN